MKPVVLGRKKWLFAGSEGGDKAITIAFTLTKTAKLTQAWLTWVLERIAIPVNGYASIRDYLSKRPSTS